MFVETLLRPLRKGETESKVTLLPDVFVPLLGA